MRIKLLPFFILVSTLFVDITSAAELTDYAKIENQLVLAALKKSPKEFTFPQKLAYIGIFNCKSLNQYKNEFQLRGNEEKHFPPVVEMAKKVSDTFVIKEIAAIDKYNFNNKTYTLLIQNNWMYMFYSSGTKGIGAIRQKNCRWDIAGADLPRAALVNSPTVLKNIRLGLNTIDIEMNVPINKAENIWESSSRPEVRDKYDDRRYVGIVHKFRILGAGYPSYAKGLTLAIGYDGPIEVYDTKFKKKLLEIPTPPLK